jgi:heat shock protein HslJ
MRSVPIRSLTLAALLAALVAACSAPAASPAASPAAGAGTLTGRAWQWTSSTLPDAATIPDPSKYTIEFMADGGFASQVDCNGVAGQFTSTDAGGITITPGPSTMAACPEGSLADVFIAGLSDASTYAIANDQLVLTGDGGTLTFQ